MMTRLPLSSPSTCPNLPVTEKLLEIPREGYMAPYETAAIVPRSKSVVFERNIRVIDIFKLSIFHIYLLNYFLLKYI
jgi:hypothetical protein